MRLLTAATQRRRTHGCGGGGGGGGGGSAVPSALTQWLLAAALLCLALLLQPTAPAQLQRGQQAPDTQQAHTHAPLPLRALQGRSSLPAALWVVGQTEEESSTGEEWSSSGVGDPSEWDSSSTGWNGTDWSSGNWSSTAGDGWDNSTAWNTSTGAGGSSGGWGAGSSTAAASSTAMPPFTPAPFPTALPGPLPTGGFGPPDGDFGGLSSSTGAWSSTGGSGGDGSPSSTGPLGPDTVAPRIDAASLSLTPSSLEYLHTCTPSMCSLSVLVSLRVRVGWSGLVSARAYIRFTPYNLSFTAIPTADGLGYTQEHDLLTGGDTLTSDLSSGSVWLQRRVQVERNIRWGQNPASPLMPPGILNVQELVVIGANGLVHRLEGEGVLAAAVQAEGGNAASYTSYHRSLLYEPPPGVAFNPSPYPPYQTECVQLAEPLEALCGIVTRAGNIYFPSVCPSIQCAARFLPFHARCLAQSFAPLPADAGEARIKASLDNALQGIRFGRIVTLDAGSGSGAAAAAASVEASVLGYGSSSTGGSEWNSHNGTGSNSTIPGGDTPPTPTVPLSPDAGWNISIMSLYSSCTAWRTPDSYYPPLITWTPGGGEGEAPPAPIVDCKSLEVQVASSCGLSVVGTGAPVVASLALNGGVGSSWLRLRTATGTAAPSCPNEAACGPALRNYTSGCLAFEPAPYNLSSAYPFGSNLYAEPIVSLLHACSSSVASGYSNASSLHAALSDPLASPAQVRDVVLSLGPLSPPSVAPPVEDGSGHPAIQAFPLPGGKEILLQWNTARSVAGSAGGGDGSGGGAATGASVGVAARYMLHYVLTSSLFLPDGGESSWRNVSVGVSNAAVITVDQALPLYSPANYPSQSYSFALSGSSTGISSGSGGDEVVGGFKRQLRVDAIQRNPTSPAPGVFCSSPGGCSPVVTPQTRSFIATFTPLLLLPVIWDATSSSVNCSGTDPAVNHCSSPFFSEYRRTNPSATFSPYDENNIITYVVTAALIPPSQPSGAPDWQLPRGPSRVACLMSMTLKQQTDKPIVNCTLANLQPNSRYWLAMHAVHPWDSHSALSLPKEHATLPETPGPLPQPLLVQAATDSLTIAFRGVSEALTGGGRCEGTGHSGDCFIYILNVSCITTGFYHGVFRLQDLDVAPGSSRTPGVQQSFRLASNSLPAPGSPVVSATAIQANRLYSLSVGAALVGDYGNNVANLVVGKNIFFSPPLLASTLPQSPPASLAPKVQVDQHAWFGTRALIRWGEALGGEAVQALTGPMRYFQVYLTALSAFPTTAPRFERRFEVLGGEVQINGLPDGHTYNAWVTPVGEGGVGPLPSIPFVPFTVAHSYPRVRALIALAPHPFTGSLYAHAESSALLNRTLRAAQAGSSILVQFDGPTDRGLSSDGSPESDPAFAADSTKWLRFHGGDGQALAPPQLTWTSEWVLGNSALLVTFSPGTLMPVWANVTRPVWVWREGVPNSAASSSTGPAWDWSSSSTGANYTGDSSSSSTGPDAPVQARSAGEDASSSSSSSSSTGSAWFDSNHTASNSSTGGGWSGESSTGIGPPGSGLGSWVLVNTTLERWVPPASHMAPQLGLTRVSIAGGLKLRRAGAGNAAPFVPTAYQSPVLGGSWNLSRETVAGIGSLQPQPLQPQQGLLSVVEPAATSLSRTLTAHGNWVHPLQQFLRLTPSSLLHPSYGGEWPGALGPGGASNYSTFTLTCQASLGFIYPYNRTGTLASLVSFLHSPLMAPGTSALDSWDYYSAWQLSGYSFVYTAPAELVGYDDTISCALSVLLPFTSAPRWNATEDRAAVFDADAFGDLDPNNIANSSSASGTISPRYTSFILDTRTVSLRIGAGNRRPVLTLLAPEPYPGSAGSGSNSGSSLVGGAYDLGVARAGLGLATHVGFNLTDPDVATTHLWDPSGLAPVRVSLRVSPGPLGGGLLYAPSVRLRPDPAWLATDAQGNRTLAPNVRSSLDPGVDGTSLLLTGPLHQIAAVLRDYVEVVFERVDAPAAPSNPAGVATASGSLSGGLALADLLSSSAVAAGATGGQLYPGLARPYLEVVAEDLAHVGTNAPASLVASARLAFDLVCPEEVVSDPAELEDPPALVSAVMSDSGDAITATFSAPLSLSSSSLDAGVPTIAAANYACFNLFDEAFFRAVTGTTSASSTLAQWRDSIASATVSSSANLLSSMAHCSLVSPRVVLVRLGADHAVVPGMGVNLRAGEVRSCGGSARTALTLAGVTLAPARAPFPPSVRIYGPAQVSLCDEVVLTASASSLGATRPSSATYSWSLSELAMSDVALRRSNAPWPIDRSTYPFPPGGSTALPGFSAPTGPTLVIPRGILKPGFKYVVGVTVTTTTAGTGSAATTTLTSPQAVHSVLVSGAPLPSVRIRADQGLNVLVRGSGAMHASHWLGSHRGTGTGAGGGSSAALSEPLVFNAVVNFSSCHPSSGRTVQYEWSVSSDTSPTPPIPTMLTGATNPTLSLDPWTLYDSTTLVYTVSVRATVQLPSATDASGLESFTSSYSTLVQMQAPPLTFSWEGGEARAIGPSDSVTLAVRVTDLSNPWPVPSCGTQCAYTYTWSCATISGAPCVNPLALVPGQTLQSIALALPATNVPRFTLAPGTLAPGSYVFSVSIVRAGSSTRTTQMHGSPVQTLTITAAPRADSPVSSLPPLFSLDCPVLNSGFMRFGGSPLLHHDQALTLSVAPGAPRKTGNTFLYRWVASVAFHGSVAEMAGSGATNSSDALNAQLGVPSNATRTPILSLNAQGVRHFFTPGLHYTFHVLVTEVTQDGGSHSTSNARCSYFVPFPPSKGGIVVSSTWQGTVPSPSWFASAQAHTTPFYLSAPHWAHGLSSDPHPFALGVAQSPDTVLLNYAFYLRIGAGQPGYVPFDPASSSSSSSGGGQGQPDPNLVFLTRGLVLDAPGGGTSGTGGAGAFVTGLPGGTYFVGVVVRDHLGASSVAEVLLTVPQAPGTDPLAAASLTDHAGFVGAIQAQWGAQLGALRSGAAAGGAQAVLGLVSSVTRSLNLFSRASGALRSYPSGSHSGTPWVRTLTSMRRSLFEAWLELVAPRKGADVDLAARVGPVAHVALTRPAILLPAPVKLAQLETLFPSTAQLDMSLAFALLHHLTDTLGLGAADAPATSFMQLARGDFEAVLRLLETVAGSAGFVPHVPTSMPSHDRAAALFGGWSGGYGGSGSGSGSAARRSLLAIRDTEEPSSSGARAALELTYQTLRQSLLFIELNLLTDASPLYQSGTASGPTPSSDSAVGLNTAVRRFGNSRGSSTGLVLLSDCVSARVTSISTPPSTSGTPLALDARIIYHYTGANLLSWASPAPLTPAQLALAVSGARFQYVFAPLVTSELAQGTAPSIGQPFSVTSSSAAINLQRFEYSYEFVLQFSHTSPLPSDSGWIFACHRLDAARQAWTSNDVDTLFLEPGRSNPWKVRCTTRTAGTVTVGAVTTFTPYPSSTGAHQSSSGDGNGTDSRSSTGVWGPASSGSGGGGLGRVTLFLIVAGCVAVGISALVGVFACYCQRRNRAAEAARKALEKNRRLQMSQNGVAPKKKAPRKLKAATAAKASAKFKSPLKRIPTLSSTGGIVGGSGAAASARVPIVPLSNAASALGASGWMSAASGGGGFGGTALDDRFVAETERDDGTGTGNATERDGDFAMDEYGGVAGGGYAGADAGKRKGDQSLAEEAAGLALKRQDRVAAKAKKDARRARHRGQSDSPPSDGEGSGGGGGGGDGTSSSDFDSDSDGHVRYNRHDHIHIDMADGGGVGGGAALPAELVGETSLALNSDYSNMYYDPVATAAAAAELAALTGQSIEEVRDMLKAQQEAEMATQGIVPLDVGMGASGAVYSYDDPVSVSALHAPQQQQQQQQGIELMELASPSQYASGPSHASPFSPSYAASPSGVGALFPSSSSSGAVVSYEPAYDVGVPVVEQHPTRTYDDSMLHHHSPLDNDPYLLAVYSPSHAANPALVPPQPALAPWLMPGRVVDTNYSRPLPPASWRLLHGRSPYGQTISFRVDSTPRWWRHAKGLDVSESEEEKRQAKLGAKRVAQRSRPSRQPAAAATARSASNTSRGTPLHPTPVVRRDSGGVGVLRATGSSSRLLKSDLRRQLSPALAGGGGNSPRLGSSVISGSVSSSVPPSSSSSSKPLSNARSPQGLRPSRLGANGARGGNSAASAASRLQSQRSLQQLVRDEPLASPSMTGPRGAALPSIIDSYDSLVSPSASGGQSGGHGRGHSGGGGGGDDLGSYGAHSLGGDLTERKDEERPRYSYNDAADDNAPDDGLSLMGGGGGDGGSTYRGYSSFQLSERDQNQEPKAQNEPRYKYR